MKQYFVDALKKNKSLTSLEHYYLKLVGNDADIIAEALNENSSLKLLSLAYNHVGVNGAPAILNALMIYFSLTKLSIDSHIIEIDFRWCNCRCLEIQLLICTFPMA